MINEIRLDKFNEFEIVCDSKIHPIKEITIDINKDKYG